MNSKQSFIKLALYRDVHYLQYNLEHESSDIRFIPY